MKKNKSVSLIDKGVSMIEICVEKKKEEPPKRQVYVDDVDQI